MTPNPLSAPPPLVETAAGFPERVDVEEEEEEVLLNGSVKEGGWWCSAPSEPLTSGALKQGPYRFFQLPLFFFFTPSSPPPIPGPEEEELEEG